MFITPNEHTKILIPVTSTILSTATTTEARLKQVGKTFIYCHVCSMDPGVWLEVFGMTSLAGKYTNRYIDFI